MSKYIKKYSQFIAGLIFLFYFLYTFSHVTDLGKEVWIALVLTIILYMQSIGEFLYFYKKLGKPRLQDWMRLSLFFMLVVDFMILINNANGSPNIKFSVTYISLLDAPITMLIIIISFIALDISYFINNTYFKRKKYDFEYSLKRKKWILGILIISSIIQSYLLFSGISGYGSNLEYTTGFTSLFKVLAGILNPFALILSAYVIFIENYKNKLYKFIFYFLILFQVFLGLLSGMKENTLIPILYVGIVFLLAGRRISKKTLYIGIFIVILLYPINNSYRNIINDPHLNTGSHALNIVLAINNLVKKPLYEVLSSGVESYGNRSSMYPYLQYAINIEPEWDYYKNMTRYIIIPVSWFIPRALWVDKPRSDIGAKFYMKLTNRDTNSITPSTIGWAYFEGNLFFLILIFILLGIVFEYIDKNNYKDPIILIFYILIFHKVIKAEWDAYFFFTSLIQMYIMYWILLKLIGIKKKRVYHEN